ncbi:MAG: heme exporter protein CcmB [Hyphomicrobium sp.]
MTAFLTLLRRDLTLALREGAAIGTALGFFLVVVAMMPLGLGPDLNLLTRIAPGILWIALLLAALLTLSRVFESDFEDGTLDVMLTAPLPLEAVVAAKSLAHWLTTGIPLALFAPLLGVLLNLDAATYPMLIVTMLVGTPAVSFLGAIGAALTLKARRGGVLLALLVLPLYIPTLIFGIATLSAGTASAAAATSSLTILAALSLASLVLGPLAAAAALRAQLT